MPEMVTMRGVSKNYGATKALTNVDFDCKAGEIHAVLGENGAGKSTLMKLLSGVIAPSSGTLVVDGQEQQFNSPRQAQAQGIVCIFQELSLSPDLTVAENIFLGASGFGWGPKHKNKRKEARQILDRIGGESIPLDARVSRLSLAERQQVEIVKGVTRHPKLLILDEATSALTATLVERVFDLLRELRNKGVAILFISHRFHEVEAIADVVSVFRSGEHVDTFPNGKLGQHEIINLMIGQSLEELFPPRLEGEPGAEVLHVNKLTLSDEFENIDFTVRHGEIAGIGGLDGQGQIKFMQTLFGCIKNASGEVAVNGVLRQIRSPKAAKKRDIGLALVPEDRKTEGLIPSMSILENMELTAHGRHPMGLLHRSNGIDPSVYEQLIAELELKFHKLSDPVSSLSGGNQQKVALIKWLALSPTCVLLLDPTRGIDVKTKAQIYRLMRRLAGEGMGVVLLSTDYDELVQLCDHVSIFYKGRISSRLAGDTLTPESVIAASLGLEEAKKNAA